MMIEFTIKGQAKSGKNRVLITRTGHRYPPKSFAVWRDDVVRQLWAQKPDVGLTFPDGALAWEADYYPGDRIRRDAPGIMDALFHCLERAEVVADDAQLKVCRGWREHTPDKSNPRLVIRLSRTELEG